MKTVTTKLRPVVFGFVMIAFAGSCLSMTASADDWVAAGPQLFGSGSSYGFKALPKSLNGVLFSIDDDGKEQVIWSKQLVNFPHRAFVAGDGKHVVTIDTYADLGREHSVVVYDDKGKVLCDYRLEELLTEQEIRDRVIQTSPNRWWAEGASFLFRYEEEHIKYFDITLNWEKVITVNLDSGKLETPPKSR